MTPQEYERLTELFHAAMETAPDERATFLDQVSAGDTALRRELESLLAARGTAITGKPPNDIAAGYLARQDDYSASVSSLAPNARLDRYEIRSLLGKGGMGEVYLAKDTSLHRLVALKLLPAAAAANEDRMRRFVQEARAAAGLTHPHIAQIFEIGEHDGAHFIAMEWVDGVTLSVKIHSEHAELRKILTYLQQVVEGLAKAHAAGIVHRDLKPDNIMITRDEYAKILDFGLAKLIEPQIPIVADLSLSSDVSTAIGAQQSLAGMVMGTAGYMSPEQVQGKVNEIDQRSDIFSFGCTLFEAVTGHRPFADDSLIKTLHRVVYEAPPLIKDFNPSAPPDLQRIVHRCLAKDPDERYQTINDVAIDLMKVRQRMAGTAEINTHVRSGGNETLFRRTTKQSATSTRTAEYLFSSIKRHRRRAIIAAVVCGIAITVVIWLLLQGGARPNPIQRVTLKRLTPDIYAIDPVLSPNGEYLAYVKFEKGQTSIWLKSMVGENAVQTMPANIEGYGGLQFSPDGKHLYYLTSQRDSPNGTICRVSTLGGIPQDIARDVFSPFALSPDGKQLAFIRARSLVVVEADNQSERELIKLTSGTEYFVTWGSQLSWSPDGSRIVVCGGRNEQGRHHAELFEISVSDGTRRILPTPDWNMIEDVMWLADGASLLVTAREREGDPFQIWRVAYPNGETNRVTEDSNNYEGITLTADSQTLVAEQAFSRQNIWLASLSDTKNARQLTSGAVAADGYSGISFAPDNTIIFTSPRSGNIDLWKMNEDGSNQQQLTINAGHINRRPSVTPDGRYIVFASSRSGTMHLWRMDADGRNDIRMTNSASNEDLPFVTADGQWIYYQRYDEDGPATMKVSINGGRSVRVSSNITTNDAVLSPDGKLLACSVYVDKSENPWKVAIIPSQGGETLKLLDVPAFRNFKSWTNDSKSLIYINGSTAELWQQPIDGGPPKKLFTLSNERLYYFAISPDFKKIAYSLGNEFSEAVLISNWRE
jgi:eukaryotic-like serine/threonine-protein kinase